jgi:hypothetical protein
LYISCSRVRLFRSLLLASLLVLGLILGSVLAVAAGRETRVAAQAANRPLTVSQVLAAFRAAGLPYANVQYLHSRTGGPSGPPTPEKEAATFVIPSLSPSGGTLYVFGSDAKRQTKQAWFNYHGGGPRTTAYRNVILWLDKSVPPSQAVRYGQALKGIR